MRIGQFPAVPHTQPERDKYMDVPKNFKRKTKAGIIYAKPCPDCTLDVTIFSQACPGLELSQRAYAMGILSSSDAQTTEDSIQYALQQLRQIAKKRQCETRKVYLLGESEYIDAMKKHGTNPEKR